MVYLWYGIFYSFLGWGLEKVFAAAKSFSRQYPKKL